MVPAGWRIANEISLFKKGGNYGLLRPAKSWENAEIYNKECVIMSDEGKHVFMKWK